MPFAKSPILTEVSTAVQVGWCGHFLNGFFRDGYRLRCSVCRSFCDTKMSAQENHYTDSYPVERRHHDELVGALKADTLRYFERAAGIDHKNRVVCEVGFGGAFPLASLLKEARAVYGIEAIASNIQHAIELGIPEKNLFLFDAKPLRCTDEIDLWIFQDSFEHIPQPQEFLHWVKENSSSDAEILIVAPEANSFSERVLGRFWPHRVPDHLFHWSKMGVVQSLEAFGFELKKEFYPFKRVSLYTLASHVAILLRAGFLLRFLQYVPNLAVWFNIGEMGLLFRRKTK